jgi:Protein of unknown function (DUF2867)
VEPNSRCTQSYRGSSNALVANITWQKILRLNAIRVHCFLWRHMVVNPSKFVVGEDEKSPTVRGFNSRWNRISKGSVIRQTAIFDPAGLAGLVYWYALYLNQRWIFIRMLRQLWRSTRQKLPLGDTPIP